MRKKDLHITRVRGNSDVLQRLRTLDRKERHAVLATESDGQPYTSLVAFALAEDCRAALFATPRKTRKFRNIRENSRVSLMLDSRSNADTGYTSSEACTILGTASPLRKGRRHQEAASLLMKKHPPLAEFIQAPTTALVLITFVEVIHAGEFQKVTVWKVND